MPSTSRSSPHTGSEANIDLGSFNLQNSASHLLRRAHFRAENLFASRLAPLGITPRQKAVLITIYQRPGATMSEVAEIVVLERQTTTEIVERLISRGLVIRERSAEDRRAYALYITSSGTAILRNAIADDAKVESDILSVIPATDRTRFIQLLQLMVQDDGEQRRGPL